MKKQKPVSRCKAPDLSILEKDKEEHFHEECALHRGSCNRVPMALAYRGATKSPTPWLVWPQLLCNTVPRLGMLSSWVTWKILRGFHECARNSVQKGPVTPESGKRGHLEVLGNTGFRRKVPWLLEIIQREQA